MKISFSFPTQARHSTASYPWALPQLSNPLQPPVHPGAHPHFPSSFLIWSDWNRNVGKQMSGTHPISHFLNGLLPCLLSIPPLPTTQDRHGPPPPGHGTCTGHRAQSREGVRTVRVVSGEADSGQTDAEGLCWKKWT